MMERLKISRVQYPSLLQYTNFKDRKGCFFVNGYALGGTDKQVGFAESAQACLDLIRNIESAANGVTWESETRKCYAEFGATHIRPECRICVSCIYEGIFVLFGI